MVLSFTGWIDKFQQRIHPLALPGFNWVLTLCSGPFPDLFHISHRLHFCMGVATNR